MKVIAFIRILILIQSSFIILIKSKNVLVIGGTGRVGKQVVSKLLKLGDNVNVLTRNQIDDVDTKLRGCTIIHGDINNIDDVIAASKDCQSIIAVHGVKPPRISKFSDLWTNPKSDKDHPYNINYLGTKKVLAAMHINKINKLVRITGTLTDKNEFSFFVFLFNSLLSKTIKWHELSEIAIRNSGIDYTGNYTANQFKMDLF